MTTPKASPSGRYQLIVFESKDAQGFEANGFRIQDSKGAVLFSPTQLWSTRHRLHFLWDADDRVWVYSSDIGTYIWEPRGDAWVERDFRAGGDLRVPDALKQLVN